MRCARINNGTVIGIIVASVEEGQDYDPDSTWVDVTNNNDVNIGWLYNGVDFTAPPPGPIVYRTVLSHQEWVNTWTPEEWKSLNDAANGTSVPPVSQEVSDTISQFLASVSASNSIDVASTQADTDYNYLEANGFISADRKAELQRGIEA